MEDFRVIRTDNNKVFVVREIIYTDVEPEVLLSDCSTGHMVVEIMNVFLDEYVDALFFDNNKEMID
jgi:hypothetical protein